MKDIPVPPRMRHLPKDARGYPVPYVVYVDIDGKPNFVINDSATRYRCLIDDLCSICGKKLLTGRWFAGGPQSAFHEQGCYIDTPMHGECVRYALVVCPYLAMTSWKTISDKVAKRADLKGITVIDNTMIDERPEVFVAVLATRQKIINYGQYIKPLRPYRRVEYWRHGKMLSKQEGELLAAKEIILAAS